MCTPAQLSWLTQLQCQGLESGILQHSMPEISSVQIFLSVHVADGLNLNGMNSHGRLVHVDGCNIELKREKIRGP